MNEIIEEGMGEGNGTILAGIEYLMEDGVRDMFDLNQWDEPKDGYSKTIEYGGKAFRIDIEEGSCIEATNEHRIMEWDHTITEVDPSTVKQPKEKPVLKNLPLTPGEEKILLTLLSLDMDRIGFEDDDQDTLKAIYNKLNK